MADCINSRSPRPGVVFPCRRCLHCRERQARELAGRQILEFGSARSAFFVTFTYADEFLPAGGNLSRDDYRGLSHWLSRAAPHGLGARYCGVAHYGSRLRRPHYHFNVGFAVDVDPFAFEAVVRERWARGFVQVGMFSPESAAYLARHQTLKWAAIVDEATADLVAPFASWSRRPALGWAQWRDSFGRWFATDEGQRYLSRVGDVPGVIANGRRNLFPVGATIRRKARDHLSLPSADPRRLAECEARELVKASDPEYRSRLLGTYDIRRIRALRRHRSQPL